jgi:hypothetical protein
VRALNGEEVGVSQRAMVSQRAPNDCTVAIVDEIQQETPSVNVASHPLHFIWRRQAFLLDGDDVRRRGSDPSLHPSHFALFPDSEWLPDTQL